MDMIVGGPNIWLRNWWMLLLRGIAGVVFGLLTFLAPGVSLTTIVLVFGGYAFFDGILSLLTAVKGRREGDGWPWAVVLEGVAGIAIGIATLLSPTLTALALLWVVAGWALATGIVEIVLAVRLRRVLTGEWLLILSGVLSVGLGVMLVLYPATGLVTLTLWVGAYALLFGVVMLGFAFRLRARRGELEAFTGRP